MFSALSRTLLCARPAGKPFAGPQPILPADVACRLVPRAAGERAGAEPDVRARAWRRSSASGLYYDCEERLGASAACSTDAGGRQHWRDALPLDYDARDRQYRGSLVGLTPDTEYAVRLQCGDSTVDVALDAHAQRVFPIGKTTYLPAGELDQPLRITEPGTADGWHLVAPASGHGTSDRRVQSTRPVRGSGGGLRHHPRTGTEERRPPRRADRPRRAARGRGRLPHDALGPCRRRPGVGLLLTARTAACTPSGRRGAW